MSMTIDRLEQLVINNAKLSTSNKQKIQNQDLVNLSAVKLMIPFTSGGTPEGLTSIPEGLVAFSAGATDADVGAMGDAFPSTSPAPYEDLSQSEFLSRNPASEAFIINRPGHYLIAAIMNWYVGDSNDPYPLGDVTIDTDTSGTETSATSSVAIGKAQVQLVTKSINVTTVPYEFKVSQNVPTDTETQKDPAVISGSLDAGGVGTMGGGVLLVFDDRPGTKAENLDFSSQLYSIYNYYSVFNANRNLDTLNKQAPIIFHAQAQELQGKIIPDPLTPDDYSIPFDEILQTDATVYSTSGTLPTSDITILETATYMITVAINFLTPTRFKLVVNGERLELTSSPTGQTNSISKFEVFQAGDVLRVETLGPLEISQSIIGAEIAGGTLSTTTPQMDILIQKVT